MDLAQQEELKSGYVIDGLPAKEERSIKELAYKYSVNKLRKPLSERYASMGTIIALDLTIVMPGTKVGAGCFRDDSLVRNRKFKATFIYCADSGKGSVFDISDKELMLIPDVQMVQSPKGFTIPSFVRLYDINYIGYKPSAPITFQSTRGNGFKGIEIISHREPILQVTSGTDDSVIEGRPQIVNRIAENGYHDVWQGLHISYYQEIASHILLIVEGDGVRVFIEKDLGFDVEVFDVLFGSL
jgi:hypothetical protein